MIYALFEKKTLFRKLNKGKREREIERRDGRMTELMSSNEGYLQVVSIFAGVTVQEP